jgi:glycosyltransferase involved in cell wall biosynthesis
MISVVIPVRDGARFLEQALHSAVKQRPVLEIIVVDDGSSDGSAEIANSLAGTVVVEQSPRGPGAARNAGASRARGEFLAFLDADDVWLPSKLEAQLEALGPAPRPALAFCAFEMFAEPGSALPPGARREQLGRAIRAPLPSALLLRREIFFRVGQFREDLATAEDVEWFQRAARAGVGSVFVERVLLRKRVHAGNTSLVAGGNTARLFDVLRRRTAERGFDP